MSKIKKGYKLTVITFVILIFLSTGSYGMDLPTNTNLRVPHQIPTKEWMDRYSRLCGINHNLEFDYRKTILRLYEENKAEFDKIRKESSITKWCGIGEFGYCEVFSKLFKEILEKANIKTKLRDKLVHVSLRGTGDYEDYIIDLTIDQYIPGQGIFVGTEAELVKLVEENKENMTKLPLSVIADQLSSWFPSPHPSPWSILKHLWGIEIGEKIQNKRKIDSNI